MVIRKGENTVFLLTSTAFPYIKDVLDLLFLPSGVLYHFRYREKWLSSRFLTKEGAEQLKGKRAFIVHIHTKKEGQDYRILEFIPLREVKIENVKVLGEYLWIQFLLGDWVYYHEVPGVGESNEFHELFKRQVPPDSREVLTKLMFYIDRFDVKTIRDDPTGESEEVMKNWSLLARHVGKLEPHQSSIFTKILSIKEINTGKIVIPKIQDSDAGGYKISAGRVYSIEVVQYYPGEKELTPFNLNLIASKVVTPIIGETEIRGKYDLLRFIIDCKSSEKTINTFMAFKAPSNDQYLISEPFINLKIEGQLCKVALYLFIFGIGVVLTSVSTQLAKLIAGEPVSPVVAGIAVIGAIFSTLGLFFLRRI